MNIESIIIQLDTNHLRRMQKMVEYLRTLSQLECWNAVLGKNEVMDSIGIEIDRTANVLTDKLYSRDDVIDFAVQHMIKPIYFQLLTEKKDLHWSIVLGYYNEITAEGIELDYPTVEELANNYALRFYDLNTLRVTYHISNGILHGDFYSYYRNGKIKTKGKYLDGSLFGKLYEHYEDGSLRWIESYLNGKVHGEYLEYYHKNSQRTKSLLYISAEYFEGHPIGEYREYFHDGILKKHYFYNPYGKLDGYFKRYEIFNWKRYLEYSGQYQDGRKIGKHTTFHHGEVVEISSYDNIGILHGKQVTYHAKRTIKIIKNYDNGLLHGISSISNDNDIVLSFVDYKHGQKHGLYARYYDSGVLRSTVWYENNKRISPITIFSRFGEIIHRIM